MPSVLVVGDSITDEYIYGITTRISPEAPVPVVVEQRRELRPGGAANVAMNVHSLGCKVQLLTTCGIPPTHMNHPFPETAIPTRKRETIKTRVVSGGQQIVRIDKEDRRQLSAEEVGPIANAYYELLKSKPDVVIVSDYCMGMITPSLANVLVHSACVRGIHVIVDTKKTDISCFQGASVITPNIKELALMGGVKAIWHAGAHAIVTKSELGVDYMKHGGHHKSIPAVHQEVVDVTGAGDTFVAALAVHQANAPSDDWYAAIMYANVAAGVVVRKHGTATATQAEVEALAFDTGRTIR